jgi:hypothetical protein
LIQFAVPQATRQFKSAFLTLYLFIAIHTHIHLIMSLPVATQPALPPTLAFMPAFQLECQTMLMADTSLISKVECLQRKQLLLDIHNNTGDTVLPGPPRDNKWKWRTKDQYRLNQKGELEYINEKKDGPWRKVVTAGEVFRIVADVHCNAIMHAGMDKTERYLTPLYKGIPRTAIRDVLKGCQACSKR